MFEEYAAKTIGIDFGTNNSVVGVYNTKIEKPLVIENEEGGEQHPFCCSLKRTIRIFRCGTQCQGKSHA